MKFDEWWESNMITPEAMGSLQGWARLIWEAAITGSASDATAMEDFEGSRVPAENLEAAISYRLRDANEMFALVRSLERDAFCRGRLSVQGAMIKALNLRHLLGA